MTDQNVKKEIKDLREIMKAKDLKDIKSDQIEGLPQPDLSKNQVGSKVINLTKEFDTVIKTNNFLELLNNRISRRKYNEETLSLAELSFLLWASQGVKAVIGKQRKATLRTVPSAGARHPFETYLFINRVEGLEPGLYHYLALEHKLEFIRSIENQVEKITEASHGQTFFGDAAVDFIWTVIPYRTEWRYTVEAQKYALIDVGHVCENLYFACEAIGCGTCAIGAYDQVKMDGLLGLSSEPTSDADNEFVVYAATVGKVD
jgi:SagB-type dehydrogenase family enzyme